MNVGEAILDKTFDRKEDICLDREIFSLLLGIKVWKYLENCIYVIRFTAIYSLSSFKPSPYTNFFTSVDVRNLNFCYMRRLWKGNNNNEVISGMV